MPTPAERKALLFLAGVIVLGASVRVVRAARDAGSADASTRNALARQLAAVDSAKRDEARPPRTRARSRGGRGVAGKGKGKGATKDAVPDSATPVTIVDLDVARESEIERLPRIGPVLARRIVEDRDQNGAFGSLEGFERVRGVGPVLAALVRAQVTFSGTARPSNALVEQRLRSPPASTKPPRRTRRN